MQLDARQAKLTSHAAVKHKRFLQVSPRKLSPAKTDRPPAKIQQSLAAVLDRGVASPS